MQKYTFKPGKTYKLVDLSKEEKQYLRLQSKGFNFLYNSFVTLQSRFDGVFPNSGNKPIDLTIPDNRRYFLSYMIRTNHWLADVDQNVKAQAMKLFEKHISDFDQAMLTSRRSKKITKEQATALYPSMIDKRMSFLYNVISGTLKIDAENVTIGHLGTFKTNKQIPYFKGLIQIGRKNKKWILQTSKSEQEKGD